jgi:glucose-1-phosphate adenylyltransferase
VCVFGADHIYRMDPAQMVGQHIATGAGVTVAALHVPLAEASRSGVIERAESGERIAAFREKPQDAQEDPKAPGRVLASMGNYVFTTEALIDAVTRDARNDASRRDLGGDIIPMLVASGEAYVYDFTKNEVPGDNERDRGYWRDVGTLDAYHDAHMDLTSVIPAFSLYNARWPILSWPEPLPPAKFVFEEEGRTGVAVDSLVCAGVIVSGGRVRRSILSPGVRVHSYAEVESSVLLHGVDIGPNAIVRNAILDKHVQVGDGVEIGVDADADRERFTVSPGGIVVIGKGQKVEAR